MVLLQILQLYTFALAMCWSVLPLGDGEEVVSFKNVMAMNTLYHSPGTGRPLVCISMEPAIML